MASSQVTPGSSQTPGLVAAMLKVLVGLQPQSQELGLTILPYSLTMRLLTLST